MDVTGEDGNNNKAYEEVTTTRSDLEAETTIEQVKKYLKKAKYLADVVECLNKTAHGMLIHQMAKKDVTFPSHICIYCKQKEKERVGTSVMNTILSKIIIFIITPCYVQSGCMQMHNFNSSKTVICNYWP